MSNQNPCAEFKLKNGYRELNPPSKKEKFLQIVKTYANPAYAAHGQEVNRLLQAQWEAIQESLSLDPALMDLVAERVRMQANALYFDLKIHEYCKAKMEKSQG